MLAEINRPDGIIKAFAAGLSDQPPDPDHFWRRRSDGRHFDRRPVFSRGKRCVRENETGSTALSSTTCEAASLAESPIGNPYRKFR